MKAPHEDVTVDPSVGSPKKVKHESAFSRADRFKLGVSVVERDEVLMRYIKSGTETKIPRRMQSRLIRSGQIFTCFNQKDGAR